MTIPPATICRRADPYHIRIFANFFVWHFLQRISKKVANLFLVKLSACASTLFYQSRGVCNNLIVNDKAKFSRKNNCVIE